MPIDRAVVEHVARLAHIGLRPEDIEPMAQQLSSVIDHVARLGELDTAAVPPTAHVNDLASVVRDDEAVPSWSPEAVLASAPHRSSQFFEVQAVLD